MFSPVIEVDYKKFSINLSKIPFLNLIVFICIIFYSRIMNILKFKIHEAFNMSNNNDTVERLCGEYPEGFEPLNLERNQILFLQTIQIMKL